MRGSVALGTSCVASLSLFVACRAGPMGQDDGDRVMISDSEGNVFFYSGRGVGEALSGEQSARLDLPVSFMRLRVTSAFVQAAVGSASHVKTVSFEVPDPSIEAAVHWFPPNGGSDGAAAETLLFHPGDAWVTGYAQVGSGSGGVTLGLFEVIKWNKGPASMPEILSQEVHTTGLLPDNDEPVLQYAGDPKTWPPVPANWN